MTVGHLYLTPDAARFPAAVAAAYAKVEAEQARLPPPVTVRERLLRLKERDQAGRTVLETANMSKLPEDQRRLATMAMAKEIGRHDLLDQAELKSLIPKVGWFSTSIYGKDGALAAWLIVQHATNDPQLMRRTVRALGRLRLTGEAQSTSYAIMYDRVALMFDNKPQKYGTQLECRAGQERPSRTEDPVHLDDRRKAMGFTLSEVSYVKSMQGSGCF